MPFGFFVFNKQATLRLGIFEGAMTERILDNLGPGKDHDPLASFAQISKQTYERFHASRGGYERSNESSKEHLLTRLMYLAESTSTAIILNATWSLSLPSMSLIRDRYEQAVRFSWLSRQTDSNELLKFVDSYYAKADRIFGNITPPQWEALKADPVFKREVHSPLSKEQREFLSRWEQLDLRSMAMKRDGLPRKTLSPIESQTLADLYTPVYQQFSSVSHGDMFGLNIIGLHKAPDGRIVIAPDPWWPTFLCIFNSLFDLIQCHEASSGFLYEGKSGLFDDLLLHWIELRNRTLPDSESQP